MNDGIKRRNTVTFGTANREKTLKKEKTKKNDNGCRLPVTLWLNLCEM